MIIVCDECGKMIDDVTRRVTCPHNPLDVPADMTYCAKHDLFGNPCPVCEPAPGRTDYYGIYRNPPADG